MGRRVGAATHHRDGTQHDRARSGRIAERGDGRRGDRVRRPGGGRKKLTSSDTTLLDDLREPVEPATRGDPQAPLLRTSKSLRHLAAALRKPGHRIGNNAVAQLLRELGYSLRSTRKIREGSTHPDRDPQFGYINAQTSAALVAGKPADLGGHQEEGACRRPPGQEAVLSVKRRSAR
jgi:Rhodopirellula transposase DDE domain